MTNLFRKRLRVASTMLVALGSGAVLFGSGPAAATDAFSPASTVLQTSSDQQFSPNIVGGTPAGDQEFPFVGRLRIFADGVGSFLCGATLIAPDLVLTAAHCAALSGEIGPSDNYSVAFGSANLDSPNIRNFVSKEVFLGSAEAGKPTQDGELFAGIPNDWALIRLKEPVDGIQPIKIADTTELDNGLFTIAGWGFRSENGPDSRTLLKAQVPFVDDATCGAVYDNPEVGFFTPELEICAGFPQGGVDSCLGDSGGPVFRKDNEDELVQVGVISWGNGCARPGFPGINTQVSAVASDIKAVAAGNRPGTVANRVVKTSFSSPITIKLTGQDPDGDPLTFKVNDPTEGGFITRDPNHPEIIEYTPPADFTGRDTFTYRANDGFSDGPAATITVVVS